MENTEKIISTAMSTLAKRGWAKTKASMSKEELSKEMARRGALRGKTKKKVIHR